MNELDCKWQDFLTKPFPNRMGGVEVQGICLTSLDSSATGCITTFIKNGYGPLDLNRFMVLQNHISQLEVIISSLNGEVLDYFVQLHEICKLVLKEVHVV